MFEGCGLEKVGERSDRLPTLPNPNTEILNTLISTERSLKVDGFLLKIF